MCIEIISVKEKVPDNDREVLVWGRVFNRFGVGINSGYRKMVFLGISKISQDKLTGIKRFDVEKRSSPLAFLMISVSHWCEIPDGPKEDVVDGGFLGDVWSKISHLFVGG